MMDMVCSISYRSGYRPVIVNIARVVGEYIQMDYNEEAVSRMEFVRVRLNWNVTILLSSIETFNSRLESILSSESNKKGFVDFVKHVVCLRMTRVLV